MHRQARKARSAALGSGWWAIPSLVAGLLAACSSTDSTGSGGAGGTGAAGQAGGGGAGPGALASCPFTNTFSKSSDCKEYTGKGWTLVTAEADCKQVFPGASGTFAPGTACPAGPTLGTCVVTTDDGTDYRQLSGGDDPSKCGSTAGACKAFAKGVFENSPTCEGSGGAGAAGGSGASGGPASGVFTQPYRVCKDPLPGEPAGQSEGGKVCTWTLISGCTEAGRHFEDYASCEDVRTQRPYYPTPPAGATDKGDPRLQDTAYLAEVAWARTQVEASACICCHARKLAPEGPGQWFTDGDGIWLDTVADSGLAMMAGLADSYALGAYPAKDNNGFDRTTLGLPTTDIPRMQKLLLAEWARRGYTPAEGADYPPFGGPLVDQRSFVPQACGAGEGVDAQGILSWTGGAARYLYVLPPGAANPGVPPDQDEPAGTLWLVDVPTKDAPFASGLAYGSLAGAMHQRLPASGAPAPLQPGATYYLYVLADIGVPLARCLFTAP
jgi:hypothetical protein